MHEITNTRHKQYHHHLDTINKLLNLNHTTPNYTEQTDVITEERRELWDHFIVRCKCITLCRERDLIAVSRTQTKRHITLDH